MILLCVTSIMLPAQEEALSAYYRAFKASVQKNFEEGALPCP